MITPHLRARYSQGPQAHLLHGDLLEQHDAAALVARREVRPIGVELYRRYNIR